MSKTSGKGLTGPNDLSSGRDETQLADVDFEDRTLGQDTQGGVQRGLRVLLHAEDGQLEGGLEFGCMSARPDTGSYRASLRWVTLALVIRWRG